MGRSKPVQRSDEWGQRIDRIDRQRETWALRARGYSYRQIAETMGCTPATALRRTRRAEETWGELSTDRDVLREGLLQLHSQLNGMLMQNLEHQLVHGQQTTETNARGESTTVTRNWVNPQVAAELGRNLSRIGQLMGLTDGAGIDGAGAAATSTVVFVSPPTDGASFEAAYCGKGDAITVDAAASPADAPTAPLKATEKPPAP
jgi:hypothetical protein